MSARPNEARAPDPPRGEAKIGVLYIHQVRHLGGASRSLFESVVQLREREVRPYLLVPRGGVADFARELGIPTISCQGLSEFNHNALGHYTGMRWLVLLREIAYLPGTILALLRARRRWGREVELLHANEFGLLLTAIVAKAIFRRPLVLHARALLARERRLRAAVARRLTRRYVDRVVAIDSAVEESFGPTVEVTVIHNGLAVPEGAAPRDRRAASGRLRVGIVANFLAFKGIYEFVEAARLCVRERGRGDLRFVLFGGDFRPTRGLRYQLLRALGFVKNMEAEITEFIRRHRLEESIDFKGFRKELGEIYGEIDVLCFPSHLDAVGRPVFEAAFFGVPSIVALRTHRTDDAIIHGTTGLIIPEKDARALADAIERFADQRDEVARMGEAARSLALERFDSAKNARRMAALYRDLLGTRGAGG